MPTDPRLYREMSEPFPSPEAAQAAIEAFFADVGELRKKHRIATVYFVIASNMVNSEGVEGQIMVPMMFGDQLMAESLTAYALGYEQAERQTRIASLLSKGVKRGKREP